MNELDLLRHAKGDNLGWRYHGGSFSFRLWLSEHDYVLVTRQVRKLVKAELLRRGSGFGNGIMRGPVVLTLDGRRRLRELEEAAKNQA